MVDEDGFNSLSDKEKQELIGLVDRYAFFLGQAEYYREEAPIKSKEYFKRAESIKKRIIARFGHVLKLNGDAIYLTGVNQDHLAIPFDEGPKWLKRRRLGCVACHGPNGKGGFLIWPSLKLAPDIRYESLTKGKHVHGGRRETHPRYTDDLIKRAVTQGIKADGKPLDPVMPRWKLSDEDFRDLLAYLKQLK